MTSYSLEFLPSARREWDKIGATIQKQLTDRLRERLTNPHVPSARLHGLPHCYKIKFKALGYRLVYRVQDDRLVVQVVAIGRRERNEVYKAAGKRLN